MHLVEIIERYRAESSDIYFREFEKYISPLIYNRLEKVDYEDREDIKQDFFVKLIREVLDKAEFHFENTDYQKFSKENLKFIKSLDSFKGLNKLFNVGSLEYFLKKENEKLGLFFEAFGSYEKWKLFNHEYSMFVADKKMLALIVCKIDSVRIDYYGKNGEKHKHEVLSLNQENMGGTEYIETIAYEDNYQSMNFANCGLKKEEIEFLKLFIDNNKVLSQTDVAKKLGISQQAIAKRLKAIREKYKGQSN